MCGIIAYLGFSDAFTYCLNGLIQLQNRGYDSAGISSIIDSKYIISKYASFENISALDKIKKEKELHNNSNIAIGHTRWATHGAKTDKNSHPHFSNDGVFCLVHNGIIENYAEIKKFLLEQDFVFKSETDTEVIVNLLSFYYLRLNDVMKSLKETLDKLEGTWGLVIMCINEPDKLYTVRRGSPILIGKSQKHIIITSEQSGFCNQVENYFILQNNDICCIEKGKELIINTNEQYPLRKINKGKFIASPEPWEHWTIREIYEQTESVLRAISQGARLLFNGKVKLGGLEVRKNDLLKIDNLILLGCGTSYNSGMIGVNYFKNLCNFCTVQLFDGADFNEIDIPKTGKTGLILISQSGETKDLHRCIEIGKKHSLIMIGVVNVVDSLIAREVDCGCYLNAGREVAVASTKAFTSQIIILNLIAIWYAQEKDINREKRIRYIEDLRKLNIDLKKTIENCDREIDRFILLFNHNSCFILGKGNGESIAREGALKIKEISYIHAEGYSTSSLKHGPFALLTENFPVILIAPDNEFYAKNENAYEEIKSRHANILFITDKDFVCKDNVLKIERNESYQDLLSIIPLQLLAYKLSKSKGLNPDMPRNLAKVVTVE